jgi:DNA invertase Pin-like site-specific DNA recombinase
MAGKNGKFIAYFRVSTRQQGSDGFGIAAQQQTVQEYVAKAGGVLLKELVEQESGKRHENRPELARERQPELV